MWKPWRLERSGSSLSLEKGITPERRRRSGTVSETLASDCKQGRSKPLVVNVGLRGIQNLDLGQLSDTKMVQLSLRVLTRSGTEVQHTAPVELVDGALKYDPPQPFGFLVPDDGKPKKLVVAVHDFVDPILLSGVDATDEAVESVVACCVVVLPSTPGPHKGASMVLLNFGVG